jgi:SAM-dependent methyltransferase
VTGRDVYATPPRAPARDAAGVSRRSLLGLRGSRFSRATVDFAGAAREVALDRDRADRRALRRACAPVAGVLADVAAVGPGTRVLDAFAADGDVALECVSRGAAVQAFDVAPSLVAAGSERCPQASWLVADPVALPYADSAFDVAVSAFGTVLVPRIGSALRELARVVRPGGAVLLSAWVPRGLPGGLVPFAEAIAPLPAGVRSPAAWGKADVARRRFETTFEDVEVRTRTVTLELGSPDALFAQLVPAAFDAERRAALRPAFDRLLASSSNLPGAAVVDARYLVVSGRRAPLRAAAREAPRSP